MLAALLWLLPPPFALLAGDGEDSFVLQITRLTSGLQSTFSVSEGGELTRWDALEGSVLQAGTGFAAPEEAARIVSLAREVPAEGSLGDGTREGDIYLLVSGDAPSARAFLEPFAPAMLLALAAKTEELARAIDVVPNVNHHLRAEPVLPERAARLKISATQSLSIERLPKSAKALVQHAIEHPYEFVLVPHDKLSAVGEALPGSRAFVALEDLSWVEVELWQPSPAKSNSPGGF
jgi:hypothetical protein